MSWIDQKSCSRCGADLRKVASTMSMFDTTMICLSCKDLEEKRPDYAQAEAKDLREYAARLDELGMQPHGDSVRKTADEIERGAP